MIHILNALLLIYLLTMGINALTGTEWAGQVVMAIIIGIPLGVWLIYKFESGKVK